MRKVRKTVYFQYSKFKKGHNSYKNWRHSNLILFKWTSIDIFDMIYITMNVYISHFYDIST